MPLSLQRCVEADCSRVFALVSICFGHEHPYIDAVFPAHDTPSGRKAGASRFLSMMYEENTEFWKVVDSEIQPRGNGEEIVAFAKWIVYDGAVPEEEEELSGEWWKDEGGQAEGKETETEEERRAYAALLFREYLVERRKAIKATEGFMLSLDILVTDPRHQRRGAGGMLVERGLVLADSLNVDAAVEASAYGRHLYETKGFHVVKLVTLDQNIPEKWAHRPKQEFLWMWRPKQESQEPAVWTREN